MGTPSFVDDNFEPYPNQWAYLASLPRLSTETVDAIADEATRTDRVIGVPLAISRRRGRIDAVDPSPIQEARRGPHQGSATCRGPGGSCPATLRREGRLTLPPDQPDQTARRVPEPRVLQEAEHAALDGTHPAGHLLRRGSPRARRPAAGMQGRPLEAYSPDTTSLWRSRTSGTKGNRSISTFQGRLTGMQEEAVKVLLSHDDGVFVAPPGTGKTVVGAYLTAAREAQYPCSCPPKADPRPVGRELSSFLGVDPKTIGRIGAGRI